MRAKKKYGQHFLIDDTITRDIGEKISTYSTSIDNVLEIGPGTGALSKHIVDQFKNYIAIEIDDEVIPQLRRNVPQIDEIINEDFLDSDITNLFEGESFLLCGNYPYNISSQIIFKMLEHKERIPVMIGMFQKEVAHRIIAGPGSKVYGVVSVLAQLDYQGTLLFDIGPESFAPSPKVDSSVIFLERRLSALEVDRKLFYQVVKQTFSQRRKMLRNTLKSFFEDNAILSHEQFNKRPEQLSVEDFILLTQLIKKHNES